MDSSNLSSDQLDTLLSQTQNGTSLIDINKIMAPLMPFIIVLSVLSVVITILWIVHLVQKIRVDKAILETRDIVREINEREKVKAPPTEPLS